MKQGKRKKKQSVRYRGKAYFLKQCKIANAENTLTKTLLKTHRFSCFNGNRKTYTNKNCKKENRKDFCFTGFQIWNQINILSLASKISERHIGNIKTDPYKSK